MKISGSQLLQPHKSFFRFCRLGRLSLLCAGAYWNKPGQRVRQFHPGEVLRSLTSSYDDGQIQTATRNVRKGPARIERQRREDREHFLKEIRIQCSSFFW